MKKLLALGIVGILLTACTATEEVSNLERFIDFANNVDYRCSATSGQWMSKDEEAGYAVLSTYDPDEDGNHYDECVYKIFPATDGNDLYFVTDERHMVDGSIWGYVWPFTYEQDEWVLHNEPFFDFSDLSEHDESSGPYGATAGTIHLPKDNLSVQYVSRESGVLLGEALWDGAQFVRTEE